MKLVHLLAALAVTGWTAGPAAAEVGGDGALRVSDVQVAEDWRSVNLTLDAADLAPELGLDPTSVQAKLNGRRLPATAQVAGSRIAAQAPTVLLVVDTSGSMLGQPMADAKRALHEFIADAPDAADVGLLRFSTGPELLVAPTTDRARLLGAVSSLQAQGETALHDAVVAGLRALGSPGDRRLVLLSDGGDTRSKASLQQAVAAGRASGVLIEAIAFNTGETVAATLGTLAAAGRGRVHRVSSAAQLSAALTETIRTHGRTLSVRVLLPEELRGQQSMTLTVATPRGVVSASTALSLRSEAVAPTKAPGADRSQTALLVGCAAIALSLLLGSLALLGGRTRDRRRVHDVLDRYTTTGEAAKPDLRTASPVTRTALELADRLATRRNLQDRLALKLERAAVTMTPAEWLLLQAGAVVATMLTLVLLGMNLFLAFLLGVLLGTVVPARVLAMRGARRRKSFERMLPDMLQMTAGSLSAGYSLAQALDGVVREGGEPMATEIGRALAESRLGVPVEGTLDAVADRMASRDFRWVVMAIRVQREVGGNLAGILTTVAATMRERAMLRRHVRALSAEGRLSAYILLGLPFFLALFMLTARGDYIRPLYSTGAGLVMIFFALLLMGIGSFLMSRMVKVEV